MAPMNNAQSDQIVKKSRSSIKWSFLGEIFAKLATPISSMVLARLLTPEIFGIVASITIITSFCETVSESGFAKLIIQKDFDDENVYKKYFSVAFYSNLIIAILMLLIICLASQPLANLVGCKGYENVLMVSSIQIPFQSMCSLYISDLRRSFQFKKIFYLRVVYCLIPFIVTIPLALIGFEYWSLSIGTISATIIQFVVLLFISKRKLKLFYSFKVLKDMFNLSFSMLLEAVVIWLCTWIGVLTVTQFYSSYDVGIFKVSKSTLNSIFIIVSSALTPVLFSSLSRLKNDREAYSNTFYDLQSICFILVIPMGIGCFVYSDVIVDIFLGNQWSDAKTILAILGLGQPFLIAYSYFLSEVFRSKGHIYTSIIYQIAMLIVQICLYVTIGRMSFVWVSISCLISNILISIVAIALLRIKYRFSIFKQLLSFVPTIVCSLFMIPFMILSKCINYGFVANFIAILFCMTAYFIGLKLCFPKLFKRIISIIKTSER